MTISCSDNARMSSECRRMSLIQGFLAEILNSEFRVALLALRIVLDVACL